MVAACVLAGATVACTTDAGVVEGETFASTGAQTDDGASGAAQDDDDGDGGGGPGGCGNEGNTCSNSAPCCTGLMCVDGQCVGDIECNEAGMICDPSNPFTQCCSGLSCVEGNCFDPNAEDTGTTGDEGGDESSTSGSGSSGDSGSGSSGDSDGGSGSGSSGSDTAG